MQWRSPLPRSLPKPWSSRTSRLEQVTGWQERLVLLVAVQVLGKVQKQFSQPIPGWAHALHHNCRHLGARLWRCTSLAHIWRH